MKFAKRCFLIAGIYGIAALLPQYFLESKNGRDFPPEITHPEYYYGFVGVALAWQVAFFIIASDPIRYRALMIPAIIEKGSFGIAAVVLFLLNRLNPLLLSAGIFDLIVGTLFLVAYLRTPTS